MRLNSRPCILPAHTPPPPSSPPPLLAPSPGTKFGCLWLGPGGELLGGFLEGGSGEQQAALRGAVAAKVVLEAGAVDGADGGADGVMAALAAKL